MPKSALSRRAVLLGLGSMALVSWCPRRSATAAGAPATRTFGYRVDILMLFGLVQYSVSGSMVEEVDAGAGRYRVLITGSGTGVSTRMEARGLIDDGRYCPLEMKSLHSMAGRQSSLSITYDYARGRADYHAGGPTLLRGRRRQGDDEVGPPPDRPLDDAISASLNFAAGRLKRGPDGAYQITVLRRTRPPGEGPDDVSPGAYTVEGVTVGARV